MLDLIESVVATAMDADLPQQEQLAKWKEDERVFYVAITRAKKALVLSSVVQLSIADGFRMNAVGKVSGGKFITKASRFLGQLGPHGRQAIVGANLPQ